MALTKDDQGIFKCAASVAPVTDWLFYGKFLLDLSNFLYIFFKTHQQTQFILNVTWISPTRICRGISMLD